MQLTGTDLGRVGIWTFQLDLLPATEAQEAAAELEELGFGAVWVPEAVSREALTNSGLLLAGTRRIAVGTGIASIWARDPMAMAGGHKTLSEAYPGRFVLGLGVSHQPLVEGMRGHRYERPLTAMRDYLDAMDRALVMIPEPTVPPVRVLAALGPKMLDLAAEKAAGAHPYFVPVEHTAIARERLGPHPLLAPEQAVVLETDPDEARRIARLHLAIYLDTENYVRNLLRLGFSEDDVAAGGSDRLVDALVAWGDVDAAVDRVQAHHDAGADHVAVQVITDDQTTAPRAEWRRLADALL